MSTEKADEIRAALLDRIDQRLKALNLTRRAAEMKAFGKPDAIRNWSRKDKNVLPRMDTLALLAPVLETTAAWLMYGDDTPAKKSLISSFDPDAPEPMDPDWEAGDKAAAYFNGGLHYNGTVAGASPEIPAAAGAGQGQVLEDRAAALKTGGIASGHPVVNEWLIPSDFVRHALGATPSQIVLIPVVGHSMEPRLFAGDRVLVDLSQSSYAGDAIYVINDGDDVLKVKTLAKIAGSSPPRFRIISEAAPDRFDELDHDQFRIIGRVVGRFSRM